MHATSRTLWGALPLLMAGRSGHRHRPGWGGPFGGGGSAPPWWGAWHGGGRGPFAGGPFGAPHGTRRGRGDVRLAVLGLLAEEPMHGYQIIREIATRSGGSWRISPGSVYPTLSALEDEGLVSVDESDGRRSFRLTEAGRAELLDRADEIARLWDAGDDAATQGWQELAGLVAQVGAAAMQVGAQGTDVERERAADLLESTRRSLYRLLADDGSEEVS